MLTLAVLVGMSKSQNYEWRGRTCYTRKWCSNSRLGSRGSRAVSKSTPEYLGDAEIVVRASTELVVRVSTYDPTGTI